MKIYGQIADEKTLKQVNDITKSKAFEGETIAIMPDNHYGQGAPIGFTATFSDKIVPNLIGVDIGCGMSMIEIPNDTDIEALYKRILAKVPSGRNVHTHKTDTSDFDGLTFTVKGAGHIANSLGSLGGGNHFIEVNQSKTGKKYLVIHSGSRNLGQQVAKHHQTIAETNFVSTGPTRDQINEVEPKLRGQFIKNFKGKKVDDTPEKALEYLVGSQVDDYLHDMGIAQNYARLNREAMVIALFPDVKREDIKHTIHNFVDIPNRIIRKGAISATEGEFVIIPLNMRDGSIFALGKGNKEANNSAPHGAGRIMSRMAARANIKLDDYVKSMEGIQSWSVGVNTLDEAPMSYKPMEEILDGCAELIEVIEIVKPIFNYKDNQPAPSYGKKGKKNV